MLLRVVFPAKAGMIRGIGLSRKVIACLLLGK